MNIPIKGWYETADHRTIIVWPDGTQQDATMLPCGVSLDKHPEITKRVQAVESGVMAE